MSTTMARVTTTTPGVAYQPDEAFARHMDDIDPLRRFREQFHIPRRHNGQPVMYFAGNSLGLQPKSARALIEQELDDWARLGVDAHFDGRNPWYPYHEQFREMGGRLIGGKPGAGEVVMMNSLTVNLHLMRVSFFHPTKTRFKMLIEDPVFPSDLYAVKTHLRTRGLDPKKALVTIKPREGEHVIRTEDVESLLASREGESIALMMLAGLNFFTGQAIDMQRICTSAHRAGAMCGFDLAHAAGNLRMHLHDWNVDFAVWCSYKYLNSGPGAVAGCFVHEKHGRNAGLLRNGGWWGNDPATRFKMQLISEFVPQTGADGWQLSNPPILAMAPLRASLDIFDAATMPALREKSLRLTGYLRFLLDQKSANGGWWTVITPREPEAHGCQLSIMVHDHPRERFKALEAEGVVCDFREPNVIRVAPAPLYNTFHECWRFAEVLARQV